MKMTDAEYFSRPEVSNSDLKLINKSYAHYLNKGTQEDTPSMAFGRAVHSFILETENEFYSKFAIMPEGLDRRTTAGKVAYTELLNSGKEIISHSDWYEIMALKSNVMNHPRAKEILDGATTEGALFGTLEEVPVRAKVDVINKGFVIDLKTCQDASKGEFMRSIGNFSYHQQAAFYLDVCNQNGLDVKGFLFIAIERRAASCGVACYVLDQESIDIGRAQYKAILAKYKYYIASPEKYKGYTADFEEIGVPQWVVSKAANDGYLP